LRTGLVNGYREVIRHPLVKVEPCGPAKGGGKIRSLLPVARWWYGCGWCRAKLLHVVRCPRQDPL